MNARTRKVHVEEEGKTAQSKAHAIVLIADAPGVMAAYRQRIVAVLLASLANDGTTRGAGRTRTTVAASAAFPHDTDRYYRILPLAVSAQTIWTAVQ